MKQDNQTIVLMHLSQLVTLALSFGSILIPLYLWMTKKEAIKDLDAHGKNILNFQFSLLIYSLICVPLVFIGVGIIGLILILIASIVYPIKNAIKASHGLMPNYPFSISFLK